MWDEHVTTSSHVFITSFARKCYSRLERCLRGCVILAMKVFNYRMAPWLCMPTANPYIRKSCYSVLHLLMVYNQFSSCHVEWDDNVFILPIGSFSVQISPVWMVEIGTLFGLLIKGLARHYCLTHSVILVTLCFGGYIEDHDVYTLTKHVKEASPNFSQSLGKCMFYW